jgi:putative salt-induced outer membrane protein YdiY
MAKASSRAARVRAAAALTLWAGLFLRPQAGLGQEAKKEGLLGPWKSTAEVSYVVTGGNTATSAFSLGTSFTRKWTKDALLFKAYILNSRSTTTVRTAQGTETDFEVFEEKFTRKVAESYLLSGSYDRNISKKLLGQAGVSWDRNRFAGVDDRVMVGTGLGYAWIEKPETRIKTSAGLTYTLRQYVGEAMESFAGFRFSVIAERKLRESSSLTSSFVFDDNLKKMEDWRFDWTNSVSAAISKSLALKLSLRTLYANVPALLTLPLFDPLGEPTNLTVQVPLKNLDMFLTTSLVINF